MRELQLDLSASMGRRAALEEALRSAIRSGRLQAGRRLPSSRVLASDLGLARSTVVGTYEQLTAEGFLVSEHGRGTSVSATASAPHPATPHPSMVNPRFDFRPGAPAADSFPTRTWLRSLRQVLAVDTVGAVTQPEWSGHPALRASLADHLGRTRSVVADPDAVVVCGGFAAGLGFVGEMLRRHQVQRVAIEQGSLPFHRHMLASLGLKVVDAAVDDEGIVVDQLAQLNVGAVIVTPANNYPFGVTLSAARRADLVRWSIDHDALVVEDDYDGEFRYDKRPIGALQALAPDRVLYGGTASKSLSGALRIGWLVVPPRLRRDLQSSVSVRAGVSGLDQLALADMIDHGALDRHVRQMRRLYRSRRDELVDCVRAAAPSIDIPRPDAGLHVLARLGPTTDETSIITAGAEHGVGLVGLQHHHRFEEGPAALVLGFSRPSVSDWAEALERLTAILSRCG